MLYPENNIMFATLATQVVLVFKTNVQTKKQAKKTLAQLLIHYPKAKINFDLSDCDKILRVEGEDISTEEIIKVLNEELFECEELE